MGRLLFIVFCLVLGMPSALAAIDKAPVEAFVKDYVIQVATGKTTGLEDDGDEFSECAKASCKVVFRKSVTLTNEDEEDENAPEIFEAQMDVYKAGQIFVRRSGCYVIQRKDGQMKLTDYKYECSE